MVRRLLTVVLLALSQSCPSALPIVSLSSLSAQTPASPDSTSLRGPRLALFLLPPSVAVAGGFVYANNAPWHAERKPFHLHNGNDFRYALNLDKAGHFYAGAAFADITAAGLASKGMDRRSALWYGAISSTLTQLGFEYKDGLAPDWGFSIYDVAAGALGAFYPWLRERHPPLRETQVKLGYARRSESYWRRKGPDGQLVDDYVNQTYWLSVRLKAILPGAIARRAPGFLRIAAGWSIDETVDGAGGGSHELFLGVDYSLRDLFGRSRSGLLRGLLDVLEYVKLPGPALRLSPTGRSFWLYW